MEKKVGRPSHQGLLGPSKVTTVAIKNTVHKKMKLAMAILEKNQTEIINEALEEYLNKRKIKDTYFKDAS